MASIYQSIEILSKEKGIDPQIVIDAVKDAMLVAARKHFRTTEDLVADFNDATGALEIYGVKKVVEVSPGSGEGNFARRRAAHGSGGCNWNPKFGSPSPPKRWAAFRRKPPSK